VCANGWEQSKTARLEAAPEEEEDSGLLTALEAAKYLKISRAHWYKLVKSGRAPGPIHLGRAVRWRRQELDAWLAAGAPPRVQWDKIRSA